MSKLMRTAILLSSVTLVACGGSERAAEVSEAAAAPEDRIADSLIVAARVVTLDPGTQEAGAVAVRDGRVLAVGSAEALRELHVGPDTTVYHLPGATVYPGFSDGHMHLVRTGLRELTLNLDTVGSLSELLAVVAGEAGSREDGEWVSGRGWIESSWDEAVFPTRDDLDAVAPDNPVFLIRADGHAGVANSRALAAAGITEATTDPFGGRIERDTRGRATGLLIDAAMELVRSVEAASEVPLETALREGMYRSARMGWTSLHVAGVDTETVDALQSMCRREGLPVRIYAALRARSAADLSALLGRSVISDCGDQLTLRAVKVSVDGALGSRGAAMMQPYEDADTRGLITWREAELRRLYLESLQQGIQVWSHAIGDRANRLVLDLYADVMRTVPPDRRDVESPRWRIEHAQLLLEADVPRFADLGVIPSMQASHAATDQHFASNRVGEQRLAHAYAWRELLDSGAVIVGGSDAPVEQGDPRIELHASITRQDLDGHPPGGWYPEQAMTPDEALRSLTVWPAYGAFQEDRLGRISPGMYADLTVLDHDIYHDPAADLPQASVLMTMVGGNVVYGRGRPSVSTDR